MTKNQLFLVIAVLVFILAPPLRAQQSTVYIYENMNNATQTGFLAGWDFSDVSGCSPWQASYDAYVPEDNSTAGQYGLSVPSCSQSGGYAALKTISFTMPSFTNTLLSFRLRTIDGGDRASFGVYVSTDRGVTYLTNPLDTAVNTAGRWQLFEYPLSRFAGRVVQIVFVARTGRAGYSLDDVIVESAPLCPQPVGGYAAQLTECSATLHWGMRGSDYGERPDSFHIRVTDPAGIAVLDAKQPYESGLSRALTGLSANTAYTAFITSDCSLSFNGESATEAFTFRTTVATARTMPFSENFDSVALPADYYTGSAEVRSGRLLMTATQSKPAYIVFSRIDANTNGFEICFDILSRVSGAPCRYRVGYVTDAGDVAGTFVPTGRDSITGYNRWENVCFNSRQAGVQTRPVMPCIMIDAGREGRVYIDNVSIHAIPACTRPEHLTVTARTGSTATLTWQNARAALIFARDPSGRIYTQSAPFPPYTFTGLYACTDYTFGAVSNCGGSVSDTVWASTALQRTVCPPGGAFSEDFNSTQADLAPDCWLMGRMDDNGVLPELSLKTTSVRNSSQGDYCVGNDPSLPVGSIAFLATPGINVQAEGQYLVSFDFLCADVVGNNLNVWVNSVPDDTVGGVRIANLQHELYATTHSYYGTEWKNCQYTIPGTGTRYVIFVCKTTVAVGDVQNGNNEYRSTAAFFDNVMVSHSMGSYPVHDIVVNQDTAALRIEWQPAIDETKWVIGYNLNGNSSYLTTDTVYGTPAYNIDLHPGRQYVLYCVIRPVWEDGSIGGGSSFQKTITTGCFAITSLPYYSEFSTYSINSKLPICWTRIPDAKFNYYGYSYPSFCQSGYLIFQSVNSASWPDRSIAVLPEIDTRLNPINSLVVDISARGNGTLVVGVMTDPQDSLSFVPVDTISIHESEKPNEWEHVVYLDAYVGAGRYIALLMPKPDSGTDIIKVYQVAVNLISACRPLSAKISNITTHSVDITINDPRATEWQLGFSNDFYYSGTMYGYVYNYDTVDVTGPVYTLDSLVPNDTYVFYIRRKCSATEYSSWYNYGEFTTRYTDCPDLGATVSNITTHSADITIDDTAATTEWQLMYIKKWWGDDGYAVYDTTTVDVTGPVYTLDSLSSYTDYYVAVRRKCSDTDYSPWSYSCGFQTLLTCEYLDFTVLNATCHSLDITIDDTAATTEWQLMYIKQWRDDDGHTVYDTTTVDVTGPVYTLDSLSSYTDYYVAVRRKCSDTDYSPWSRSVGFRTRLTCEYLDITALSNITGHSADIMIDDTTATTEWQLMYRKQWWGDDGYAVYDTTTVDVTGPVCTLDSLMPDTYYDVAVRRKCSDTDYSPWSRWYFFRTPLSCEYFNATAISNITAHSADIMIDDTAATTEWQLMYRKRWWDGDGYADYDTTTVDVTGPVYTLDSLSSYTDYYVAVRRKCSDTDYSPWSRSSGFQTLPTCDFLYATVSNITSHSADITIDDSIATATTECQLMCITARGDDDGYYYPIDTTTVDVTGPVHTLDSLSPYTDYFVAVRRKCSDTDYSPWGGYYQFLTAVDTTYIYQTICFGGGYSSPLYTIPDGSYAPGSYDISLNTDYETKVVTMLHLTVLAEDARLVHDTICSGYPYLSDGWNIPEPRSHRYIRRSVNDYGCTASEALDLYVIDGNADTRYDTICQGEVYNFNGRSLTQSGTYTDTVGSSLGCSSMITLHLTVIEAVNDTVDATICQGESFQFHGRDYSVAGTYDVTEAGSRGCDNHYLLRLAVLPTDTTVNVSFCEGASAQVSDTVITSAGSHTFVRRNAHGCLVTYHVNATVTSTLTTDIDDYICQGDTYTGYGFRRVRISADTVLVSGPVASAGGCDSITRVHVTVVKAVYDTVSATICQGESFQFHGRDYSVAGTYAVTTLSDLGCDEHHVLRLAVLATDTTVNVAFCEGASAQVSDTVITQAGSYTIVRLNAHGCLVTYHIHATVADILTNDVDDYVCQGDTYTGYGFRRVHISADTVLVTEPVASAGGCDSVTRVHVAVHPVSYSYDTAYIAAGESYTWHDRTLTEAGDYTITVEDSFGCDSVLMLHLGEGTALDYAGLRGRVMIVPNPTAPGAHTLIITEQTGHVTLVEVLSTGGALVSRTVPQSTPVSIAAPTVPGVYMVRITTADGNVYVEKLIVND